MSSFSNLYYRDNTHEANEVSQKSKFCADSESEVRI